MADVRKEAGTPLHEDKFRTRTGIPIDRKNNTSLFIEQAIRENGGKVPYSTFMGISLFGPEGYYSSGKARINEGDFDTYAKIPHFGASIGIASMKTWEAMGKPDTFQIVEMGAGGGHMAKHLLTWARKNQPEFYDALSYVIVEYGTLIDKQKQTIAGKNRFTPKINTGSTPEEHERDLGKVQWVQGSASELPLRDVEGVFVSNELPDAFPVELVKKINGQVRQKYVTLEEDEWVEKWDEPSSDVLAYISRYGRHLTITEDKEEPINPTAITWLHEVNRALKRGAIITVDYGNPPDGSRKERAIRTKPRVDLPYNEYRIPGNFDMTSNQNFDIFRQEQEEAGNSIIFSGSQGDFLLRNDVATFIKPEIDAIKATKSLHERLGLETIFSRGSGKMLRRPVFFAQVSTKGITMDMPPTGKTVDEVLSIPISLKVGGEPNTRYTISSMRHKPRDGDTPTLYEVTTDNDGNMLTPQNLNALFLLDKYMHTTITNESGDVVIDSTNEKQVVKLFEDSGYTFDIPRSYLSLGGRNKTYKIKIVDSDDGESDEYTITSGKDGKVSLWNIHPNYGPNFLASEYLHSTITDESGTVIASSDAGKEAMRAFLAERFVVLSSTSEEPMRKEGRVKRWVRNLFTGNK